MSYVYLSFVLLAQTYKIMMICSKKNKEKLKSLLVLFVPDSQNVKCLLLVGVKVKLL